MPHVISILELSTYSNHVHNTPLRKYTSKPMFRACKILYDAMQRWFEGAGLALSGTDITSQLQSDNPFDKERVPWSRGISLGNQYPGVESYDTWDLRLGVVYNMLLAYRLLLAKLEVKLLRSTRGICLATNQMPLDLYPGSRDHSKCFEVDRKLPNAWWWCDLIGNYTGTGVSYRRALQTFFR